MTSATCLRSPCSSSMLTASPSAEKTHSPATAIGPGTAGETSVTAIAICLEASPLALPGFQPSGWHGAVRALHGSGRVPERAGAPGYRSCVEGIFLDLAVEKTRVLPLVAGSR